MKITEKQRKLIRHIAIRTYARMVKFSNMEEMREDVLNKYGFKSNESVLWKNPRFQHILDECNELVKEFSTPSEKLQDALALRDLISALGANLHFAAKGLKKLL